MADAYGKEKPQFTIKYKIKEDMDKLFQPFRQIDVSLTKKHEGTGLGLYISKKLAVLLGGDISARSEYGRGSEFTFIAPLRYEQGN